MANWLDKLPKQLAAGFKGQLRVGTLRKQSYVLDRLHDRSSIGHTDYTFTGIREDFDARYRQQALIPETDVKVMVLLGSLPKGIAPGRDDQVQISSLWHKVREVMSIDPASATAMLQCYQIDAPVA